MHLDGDQWSACFRDFARSAWRLELLPSYAVARESDSLARFLRGEPKPAGHNAQWQQRVRSSVAAGKSIGRVRVVRRPLTDYQRYQFAWGIPGNAEAGEDIRVLDLTDAEVELPDHDFWIFDDSRVVRLDFAPDGTLEDRELVRTSEMRKYLEWRSNALSAASRLSDYATRS